jgi:hypothetical protein
MARESRVFTARCREVAITKAIDLLASRDELDPEHDLPWLVRYFERVMTSGAGSAGEISGNVH